jgi:hypothetical protein
MPLKKLDSNYDYSPYVLKSLIDQILVADADADNDEDKDVDDSDLALKLQTTRRKNIKQKHNLSFNLRL